MGVKNRSRHSPLARSLGRTRLAALGQRCWRLVPLALVCQATSISGFEVVVQPATIAPAIHSIGTSAPKDSSIQQAEYRSVGESIPAFRPSSEREIVDPSVMPAGNKERSQQSAADSSSIVKRNLAAANQGVPIPKAVSAQKSTPNSVTPEAVARSLPAHEQHQVALHRELNGPTSNKPQIKKVSSQGEGDADGMLVSAGPVDPNAHYPTIIYNSPEVTLFVPPVIDPHSQRVIQVVLRKMTGNQAGEEIRASVEVDHASFRSLDSGMYEVEYLKASSTFVPPRRRIIIELNHDEVNLALPSSTKKSVSAKPATSSPKSVDLMGDRKDVVEQLNQSEDLLERGATYTALRGFQSTIRACASENTTAEVGTALIEFLDNPIATSTAISNHRLTTEQVAKCFADQVNRRADLAPAFFGLGRAYQLVESEEKPLISQAASSAEICHMVANQLDPTLAGPMREIGARRLAQGRHLEAIQCLESAIATAPDADAHFLLGQVHAAQGNARSAIASYIEANRLDPRYLPAAYELARLDLETATRALYPADVADLVQRLQEFGTCDILDASDRTWAQQELSRVLWIKREAEVNLGRSTAARAASNGEKSPPRETVASSAQKINQGKLSVPDRKLPEVMPSGADSFARRPLSIEVRKNGSLASVSSADLRTDGNEHARLIPSETPTVGSNRPVITPTSGVDEQTGGKPIPRASAAWESKIPPRVDVEGSESRRIPVAEARSSQVRKSARGTGELNQHPQDRAE
ncbi:hypothetical protein K2Y11_20050 [bacterium]|nr:hypothetical protein [bacterium]